MVHETIASGDFVAHLQRQVNRWLTSEKSNYIQLDLVRFYHDDDAGQFAMLFNTYGWQGYQTEDDYECFKTGWWTWICLKSDGSDVEEKKGVERVVADVYKEHAQRLLGASWVDEDAILYAK